MASIEDDAKKLAEYARAGGPPNERLVPRAPPHRPWGDKLAAQAAEAVKSATVTPLNPKKSEPTLTEEILQMLDELTADIRSGKVEPSHLIMGWGEKCEVNGEPATTFVWDSTGLNRFEACGHLQTYALKLAVGNDLV